MKYEEKQWLSLSAQSYSTNNTLKFYVSKWKMYFKMVIMQKIGIILLNLNTMLLLCTLLRQTIVFYKVSYYYVC